MAAGDFHGGLVGIAHFDQQLNDGHVVKVANIGKRLDQPAFCGACSSKDSSPASATKPAVAQNAA